MLCRDGLQCAGFVALARADGDAISDRAAEHLGQTVVIVWFKGEVGVIEVTHQQALSLEVAADALAYAAHERFELGFRRRLEPMKAQTITAADIDPIEQQHVKV